MNNKEEIRLMIDILNSDSANYVNVLRANRVLANLLLVAIEETKSE